MKILIHVVLSAVAVFAASRVLPGVKVDSFATALTVAVVLGLVNAFLRPVLILLTLPVNILSLGLFTFVIIGACVLLVTRLVPGFQVNGMLSALEFAFALWLINGFFHTLGA